jgi:hypothetical protein
MFLLHRSASILNARKRPERAPVSVKPQCVKRKRLPLATLANYSADGVRWSPNELWYALSMSTVSYLDRFLEPVTESFTPALARILVDLRADDELHAEIEVLRQKANLGTLTPDEEAAYRDFVDAVDVISIIQAKARRILANHPA